MLGPIRSILFVPGARPDRFAKAEAAGADAVVFDLEDSVDAAGKQAAREAIAAHLSSPATTSARIVRFNAATSAEGERDIAFFHGKSGFDALVLPKIEGADVVERVAKAFSHREAPTPIIPLIETPLGILRAAEIVTAQAKVPAILFGAEDLTARLGAARTVDGDELLFARGQLAMAAALVEAEAIDAVYTNVKDLAALRRDAERARGIGFRGKMAIHPAQVPVIHEVFTPSSHDVERARRVVAAWDAAQATGEAITRLGDEMIELPIVERARRVLARARA